MYYLVIIFHLFLSRLTDKSKNAYEKKSEILEFDLPFISD